MEITRRHAVAGLGSVLAAPFILKRGAWAQGKTIKVGIYAGSQGRLFAQKIIPAFQEKFGCTVNSTEGASLAQIAILRTQKADPQYSVMLMDDAVLPMAAAENLIAKLPADKLPNIENVWDKVRFENAVSFAVAPCGAFYSTANGKPLESYSELWEPKYSKQILTPTASKTQSVFLVVAAAALATGKSYEQAQYELEAAWPKLKELKDNVLTMYDNSAQIMLVAQD
ncbi:substrate-binding domain-containing protein [Agrobacterium rosae]|uniref:substrate-binding domain-containing protein n=1 Tax=Agrobacterium rosae TaxID=1972867 RepID=UPI00387AEFA2